MARTIPTQTEVASSYTLWCEHFDILGIDSREDFDAMPFAEKMEMLAFAFGEDVDIESAPPMTPERAARSTRPTDAELAQLLRLTHTPLTDQSLSCKGCGETWPCANVQAADALNNSAN